MAGTNILVRQKDLIAGSGISITPDTTSGNVTIAATNTAIDESRLLPETGSVSSDSVGNPVIFKAISRIDNTYWLCLPLNEDTNDRSTYDVATEVYGTVNIVSNAPSSPGGSAFFNGSSCLHGTLPAQFGASDFTVRFWMMAPTISSSSQTIFSTRYGDRTDASTFALLCTTEGRLFIYSNGDITSRTDTPFTLQPSVWYHVAVVRKSGVLTIYVNGEVYNSATFTNSLTRQIFGLGASWTGSSYSEAGTVYLTSLDVLNYAAYDGAFTTPAYQPGILAGAGYEVATDDEVKNMLSTAGIDESRLLPENPANGDIPCFDATATVGGGNDANTRILLHFDADEIKDEAAGNAAPVTITKKTGTITVVEGGKWGKCAKYVTGSMTVATNLDELNANNWVVSGWFNPDENNHGVSYPTWLSMDDQNTHGFGFDSTGRYGESDGPLFYLDTPPASGTWHWLAIVKYSGGLRFYLNGAFLNEISAQQRANFCSTLAIGGFAGTHAAGSTERTFSGLVDEVRLQYIPDDEITQWTGTSIAVPDAPYSKPQTVGEWGKFNKAELVKSVNGQLPDSSGAVTIPVATASAAGLMTATDKVKLDALQQGATYINTATDFDTYKTAGSYFLKGAVHTNGPLTDSYAGTLVVVAPAELQYATQYFTQLYTNKTFVRTYSQDNSAWSAWRRIIVDTDLATTTMAGLMPAADKAAIAGLTARGIYPNALVKYGAIDFNEVIDHGFYFIGGDTPHLNYPETYQQTGGTLQVLRYGNYLTQTFIVFDKSKSFNRSCFNAISGSSERTFSAWRRLLMDADITESKARPGYFKLPGGTIVQWGAATIMKDGLYQVTFPIAFPNVILIGNATAVSGTASASGVVISINGPQTNRMTLITKNHPGNDQDINVHWLAIGY